MPRDLLFPIVLFLASAASAPAAAQTVIYRCTDAKGAVTMQNDKPCAPGMKQEIRNVGTLPTAPAPTRRAETPATPMGPPPGAHFELVRGPTDPLPASTVPEAERKAPPALFTCETAERRDRYLSADGKPAPRCVPLQTIGIDGSPGLAGGEACEMKQDSCTAITGAALCQAWRHHVDEAQFRMRFAADQDRAERKAEYDRRAQALSDSDCAR